MDSELFTAYPKRIVKLQKTDAEEINLGIMETVPTILSRRNEKEFLASLNDRFSSYVTKIRSLREQSRKTENSVVMAVTQGMENEIMELKSMYERELESLRDQLDKAVSERNMQSVTAASTANMAADLEDKLTGENFNRRQLEVTVANNHRFIAERDAAIQELRISIAQHQNALMEANTDRDTLQRNVTTLQNSYDAEVVLRTDLQSKVDQLTDKINFERDLHQKDVNDLQSRLNAAEEAIIMAEDRLKEHDVIDDQLANTLAKVKLQAHEELVRFQQEAAHSYGQSLTAIKHKFEEESKKLAQANENNIHLMATVDEQVSKIAKLETKCAAVEEQNQKLSQTMEVERTQKANTIRSLEEKLRKAQDKINDKIRELNLAHNTKIPVDLEIEAFAGLLDAEEKRLMLELHNPAPEIINRAMLKSAHAGRRPVRQRSCSNTLPPTLPKVTPHKPTVSRPKLHPVSLTPLPTRLAPLTATSVPATLLAGL